MAKHVKLITPTEAAKILKITRQGLNYLVKRGKVKPVETIDAPATLISKYKFFDEEAILKYWKSRR